MADKIDTGVNLYTAKSMYPIAVSNIIGEKYLKTYI